MNLTNTSPSRWNVEFDPEPGVDAPLREQAEHILNDGVLPAIQYVTAKIYAEQQGYDWKQLSPEVRFEIARVAWA